MILVENHGRSDEKFTGLWYKSPTFTNHDWGYHPIATGSTTGDAGTGIGFVVYADPMRYHGSPRNGITYPLVNVYTTMENHHVSWESSLKIGNFP